MTHMNQSQLKLWRWCQQAWEYKYGQHLVPKKRDRPRHLGSWFHGALQSLYRDGDWRIGHQVFLDEYLKLFDEEREALDKDGPLPELVERMMASYLWQWQEDGWEVVEVEKDWRLDYHVKQLDVTIPFGGKIDLIVRDGDGLLWIVDHKTTQQIPEQGAFHAMDPQLVLYPWGAKRALGIDVAGVIFNYVRSKAPTIPHLNKDKTISKQAIVTDYPTALTFLLENALDPDNYSEYLDGLKGSTELFRRYKMPTNQVVTARVLTEAVRTALAIARHKGTVRNVTRDCIRCDFQQLCRAELFGLDTAMMRRRDFTVETDEEGDTDGDYSSE